MAPARFRSVAASVLFPERSSRAARRRRTSTCRRSDECWCVYRLANFLTPVASPSGSRISSRRAPLEKNTALFSAHFGTLSLLIHYRLTGFGRLRCREDRFSRQNNPALLPYSRPGGLPKNGPGKF